MRQLVARGADVNGVDHSKRSPLDYGLHGGDEGLDNMMMATLLGSGVSEGGVYADQGDQVNKDAGE